MARPRWFVWLQAIVLRTLARTFVKFQVSKPDYPKPLFRFKIPTTISTRPGKIELLFYGPPSFSQPAPGQKPSGKGRPVIVNLHGGGYTIGSPDEDGHWIKAILDPRGPLKDAVVVSVDYRLAPEYYFPTPVEDCADAILWVWEHADEYGFDREKMAVSGFSAGGNLSFSGLLRLAAEMRRKKQANLIEDDEGNLPKVTTIAAFYPSCNQTRSPQQKMESNPHGAKPIMPGLINTIFGGLFENAYRYSPSGAVDESSPYMSPGLVEDSVIQNDLPDDITIITCQLDPLLTEAEEFRERLSDLGKRVKGYMVKGVVHGWDKRPTLNQTDLERRTSAYELAVAEIAKAFSG